MFIANLVHIIKQIRKGIIDLIYFVRSDKPNIVTLFYSRIAVIIITTVRLQFKLY